GVVGGCGGVVAWGGGGGGGGGGGCGGRRRPPGRGHFRARLGRRAGRGRARLIEVGTPLDLLGRARAAVEHRDRGLREESPGALRQEQLRRIDGRRLEHRVDGRPPVLRAVAQDAFRRLLLRRQPAH